MQYILRKIHLLRIIVFAKSNNLKLAVFFDNSSIKLFYYLFLLNWQRYSNYLISNSIIMEVIIFYFFNRILVKWTCYIYCILHSFYLSIKII